MNATSSTAEQLVADYLARIDAALVDLPAARRQELVDQVRGHVDEALSPADRAEELPVRKVLDELGSPADIAAEARRTFADEARPVGAAAGPVDPRSTALQDVSAIMLLLFGGLVLGIGWIVGLILLWASRTWRVRDKLVGTLLLPGGLMIAVILVPAMFLVTAQICTSSSVSGPVPAASVPVSERGPAGRPDDVVLVSGSETCEGGGGSGWALGLMAFAVLAPVGSAAYLGWRRRQADPSRRTGEI